MGEDSDIIEQGKMGLFQTILSGLRGDIQQVIKTQQFAAGKAADMATQLALIEQRLAALEASRKAPSVLHPVLGLLLGAIFATAVPPLVRAIAHTVDQQPFATAPPTNPRRSAAGSTAGP